MDRSGVSNIGDISPDTDFIQVRGILIRVETAGEKRAKRLMATLKDATGTLELVWFQGIQWVQKTLKEDAAYLVYGRVTSFNGRFQISHPEMDILNEENAAGKNYLEPVYPSTEKLKAKGLGNRQIGKLTKNLFDQLSPADIFENIPSPVLEQFRLMHRGQAWFAVHFPKNMEEWKLAQRRLKFEEFFISQVRIFRLKMKRQKSSRGFVFEKVGDLFNEFYRRYLPFELTGAQKRVLKEIRQDTLNGRQMNRLLQGDVGSGKTMVALLSMLLSIDNGFQACLMAPTEILSQQHYRHIKAFLENMPVSVALLTGNVKGKARKALLERVASGELSLLVGTHALIEEEVGFKNIGLAIVDEQHRFGVAQRAALWKKNNPPPHILVMTATPIPRTLAMTVYGDLDLSVIDELPPGRKPITTVHRTENRRSQVIDFIRSELASGRQAYIVYPLIAESEKLDYENLMAGYENIKGYFPEPAYRISMVHGKQTQEIRETNMQRFASGECHIMVATTVIEVGVNIPNASVMVIESAERFGLSQLHQLRGRVGRGADQSYCILITGSKMSKEAGERIRIMTQTNDGFIIAEKDMELRGPGDIETTRQSGVLDFKMASIIQDKPVLDAARAAAEKLLSADPELEAPENKCLRDFLTARYSKSGWSKIS